MAYAVGNPKTKKRLKELVKEGPVQLLSYPPHIQTGLEYVEGPHYPEPHRWYAKVEVVDGKIVKVLE